MSKVWQAGGLGMLCVLVAAISAQAQPPAPDIKIVTANAAEGARTWGGTCSGCHGPGERGPDRNILAAKTADEIYDALVNGKMKSIGDTMMESERRAIAQYLTGRPLTVPPAGASPAQ